MLPYISNYYNFLDLEFVQINLNLCKGSDLDLDHDLDLNKPCPNYTPIDEIPAPTKVKNREKFK